MKEENKLTQLYCYEYWCNDNLLIHLESDNFLFLLDRFYSRCAIVGTSECPFNRDVYLCQLGDHLCEDTIILEFHKEESKNV